MKKLIKWLKMIKGENMMVSEKGVQYIKRFDYSYNDMLVTIKKERRLYS